MAKGGSELCLQLGRLGFGVRWGLRLLLWVTCTLAGFGGISVGWGAGLRASRWHS